ncbi:MAG: dihydroneopterin aldolase [Actinophytocola sp.]|nr:dihydroneopterin aldolase [Actinophytocola sp.]
MTDRIALTGLRAFGRHGVFAQERRDGQEFLVDIVLRLDLTAASRSDALADTVDYGALAEIAVKVVGGDPYDLIESVAGRIAEEVLADERMAGRIESAEVTVHKPGAPIPHRFADVAVTVTRSR